MDLKKSALALLALGLSGVASAGGFMPAPACTNHPVTVPCERSAWDIGFTAYWVRPSEYNLTTYEATDADVNAYLYSETDYKFGFGLEGSFHWGTGNDLTLSWTRYHKGFDNEDSFSSGPTFVVSASDFEFDAVNLELGQHIDVGPNWTTRLHFGLQYAKLDHELIGVEATDSIFDSGSFDDATFNLSEFRGIGPRVGTDLRYNVSNGFGVVAHSAVALLAGDLESSTVTGVDSVGGVLDLDDAVFYGTDDRRTVVANIDSKIGLGYNANVGNGTLQLEIGYAVNHYFDVIARTPVTTSTFSGLNALGYVNTSNFSLNGLYATAKYVS